MVKVAVVIGSESDREKGLEAVNVLKRFGVEYDLRVLSAHRNPKDLEEYLKSSDAEVFIAIAGLSAALPGYIASRTIKPVIGVPREVKVGGLDALLSTVQMPSGVPVACVGIDNAKNAAILAIEILSLKDEKLEEKLREFRSRGSRL
ncbi:5-(carboxyamino)imidazole ribonucleotide mutase [Candidatus Bathyarchaeota archaeon]|nr:5-(carboxyamino)imidazole ribonucleotide mutase [Candidatus Bathyarchaeota archaeon]